MGFDWESLLRVVDVGDGGWRRNVVMTILRCWWPIYKIEKVTNTIILPTTSWDLWARSLMNVPNRKADQIGRRLSNRYIDVDDQLSNFWDVDQSHLPSRNMRHTNCVLNIIVAYNQNCSLNQNLASDPRKSTCQLNFWTKNPILDQKLVHFGHQSQIICHFGQIIDDLTIFYSSRL